MLHLESRFVWCWNLDTSEIRSDIIGEFWNVVLEKDGEDHLDGSRKKLRNFTKYYKHLSSPFHFIYLWAIEQRC